MQIIIICTHFNFRNWEALDYFLKSFDGALPLWVLMVIERIQYENVIINLFNYLNILFNYCQLKYDALEVMKS